MASGTQAMAGDTGFLDRSVTVGGVSYRYQVYVPMDRRPGQRLPVAFQA